MPKIPEYENQLFPNAAPLARAASSAEQSGYYRANMIRQGFNALGEGLNSAVSALTKQSQASNKLAEQEEVAGLTGSVAEANAGLTVAWQTKLASYDPGSGQDIGQDFIDKDFSETFDKIGENIQTEKGRQYFEKAKAHSFANFYTHTSADIANVKGKWGVDQANKIYTKGEDQIISDPTQWRTVIGQSRLAVDAMDDAHGFGALKKEELNTKWGHDFALAAAKQMIHDDAELGSEAVRNGDFDGFLSEKEQVGLMDAADKEAQHQSQAQLTRDTAEQNQRKRIAQQQLGELQASVPMNPDGTFNVPADYTQKVEAIARVNKDALSPAEIRSAQNWAAVETRRANKSLKTVSHNDPDTDEKLFDKLMHHELTEQELDDAKTAGKLTTETWKSYKKALLKPTAQNKELGQARGYVQRYTTMIGKTFPTADLGTATVAQYQEDMLAKFTEMRDQGMKVSDWQSWAQQQVPLYFYGKAHAKPVVDSHVEANKPPISDDLKPHPGESPADYLKRRGL